MGDNENSSVEQLQVGSHFETLRKTLLTEEYSGHLDRTLAYWALPTDRRLPLALLGRSLKDLLDTPYEELSKTPGIGQKKIASFVSLLSRAAKTAPSELPEEIAPPSCVADSSRAKRNGHATNSLFDPTNVSEVLWNQWRASVAKHGLADECLGRFAPTLRDMTRVIWKRTLGDYTEMSLTDLRSKKTHGEKRIRAILDVFHSVHSIVAGMGTQSHLVVRIVPRLIDQIEQWIGQALQTAGVPSEEELFENFVNPLLEQITNDATEQISSLAENRLGITEPVTSVRQAARSMGLMRARVYQLLNEINDIITVRWPDGRHQVYELREKLLTESSETPDSPDLSQFLAAVELFYPGSRRGAAGPLEQGEDEVEEPSEPAAKHDESTEHDDAKTSTTA